VNQPHQGRQLILIGGGARSGKSSFALRLAQRLGPRRVFLATAEARDEEMAGRIARHQSERRDEFETIEEPLAPAAALARVEGDVVVIDCVTFWLANLLLRGDSADHILEEVAGLVAALRAWPGHAILVTNEVGMGVVPEYPLGRAFRDVCGTAHQHLSRAANQLYFAALGTILRLRPGPVEVCDEDVEHGEGTE
jgi:adenosylcobinamide kinase/adenosylcobinamide-phosphate guanylyltransferase